VRALQLNTAHRVAFADLALLLMETDDREGALKIIRQALKANPNSAEALFLLGLLSMEGHNEQSFAQAATFFENAIKVRPDLAASLFNSALCQYMMGFRDPAAKLLERVTSHDPSIAPAYYLIGMGHATAGRFTEALWAWQTALQYEPENAELQANIGFIHFRREDFPSAVKHYLHAHQLAPHESGILGGLGLSYAMVKQLPRAIEALQRSLQINPNNPVIHSNLGLAYYIVKMVEQAMEQWRMVSQLDKGYAERRQEEQQRSFDDSLVSLMPVNWRTRVIRLAPALPRPYTRLLPGFNSRAFRPAIADPALLEAQKLRQEIERDDRLLAWMNIKQ
jgi:tetratricopeptide (TPR) repeat protein